MAGWIIAFGCFALMVWGHLGPHPEPAKPPARPVVASDDGDWLLLPFQLVGGLAALCWLLVCLAAFLAPLAFAVLLVAGLVAR